MTALHRGVVLIDGRSGSGKTELARALVEAWPEAQLLRLDDLYPGWHGLAAGSEAVAGILTSLEWRAWDWEADRVGDWRELDASRPVVVEGVGAISRSSRPVADLAVWVELDDISRKRRALERDGDTFAPHWDHWAAQELDLIARERPRDLADLVVDGREATKAVGDILVELDA